MMKKRQLLTVISLLLVLAFVMGQAVMLASCKKPSENGDDTTSGDTEETLPPVEDDGEAENLGIPLNYKYTDTEGKLIVNANYCADMEKKRTEPISTTLVPKAEGAPSVAAGFLWNASTLLVILDNASSADKITLTVGDNTTEVSGSSSEIEVAFADTGILPQDLGQLVAVKLVAVKGDAESEFDGFIQLADYKVHYSVYGEDLADLTLAKAAVPGSAAAVDKAVAGVEIVDGSYHLYDKYVAGAAKAYTQVKLEKKGMALSSASNLMLDVNIRIDKMPIYNVEFVSTSSAYGLYFSFTKDTNTAAPFFFIVNTEEGLVLATHGKDGSTLATAVLGRKLGDAFRLTAIYDSKQNLSIAVDGYVVKTFEAVSEKRAFASGSVNIVWQRGKAAASSADDFDITIDSIHLTTDQSKSLTDNIVIGDLYADGNVVQLDGAEIYLATDKLVLDAEITSRKYGLTAKANWFSSNEKVITTDGAVTSPPTSGRFVTLSLLLTSGDDIVTQKAFKFFVKGLAPTSNVLQVKGDSDPFRGKGSAADTVFSLRSCNSVVYDMGETTDINRATLVSRSTNIGLINKNSIGLFYSNDNETYTLIEDFSMLQTADRVYFYNFDVEARYLKVHFTNALGEIGKITNSLQYLMNADCSDKPLLATGDFANEKTVNVKNSEDEKVYDEVVSFTLSDLGLTAGDLKEDMSDIRFLADGEYLPHYSFGDTFYVRVLEMDANESLDIKVLYGNENAKSVSDGNEVFEIQYGLKYAENNLDGAWVNSVAEMPNGDLMKMIFKGVGNGITKLFYYRSTNAGQTWTGPFEIENSGMINHGGAFIVDKENETVFFYGCNFDYGDKSKGIPAVCTYYIFKSTDNGYTWEDPVSPKGGNIPAPLYSITYSDGITLSTADGDGPEVDYVIGTGILSGAAVDSALNAGAIYSKDGGKTWIFSDSRIQYNHSGLGAVGHESGMSEEAIFERKDGTLMMYSRCQFSNIVHFAISYSYDKGVTWTTPEKDDLSNFYASNTQPIIEKLDGEPVLLWGGNNSVGGRSYYRVPLNMATTQNDGDTFENLVDTSFQTIIANFANSDNQQYNRHVNPDLVFVDYYGEDLCYITSTGHKLRITNVDDFLNKTKGGYDSFEDGYYKEGWITSYGYLRDSKLGVTEGNGSMKIDEKTLAVRSLHYMEAGEISFDFFVEKMGEGFSIELQTAFNHKANQTAPVKITVTPDGQVYAYTAMNGGAKKLDAKLGEGQHSMTLRFDGNAKTAELVLDGKSYDVPYIGGIGNYISFFTVFTGDDSSCHMDRFIAIRNK